MGTVLGIAHFSFHEGQAEEFKRLSRECLERVRSLDTGTLRYEIYLNADETAAVVVEEYVDAAALLEHAEHIGDELSAQIAATGDVHGEVLGDLPPDVLERFASGPVRPFAPLFSLADQG